MKDAEKGFPYKGAKEHYILDLDNKKQVKEVISKLESITLLKNKKRN